MRGSSQTLPQLQLPFLHPQPQPRTVQLFACSGASNQRNTRFFVGAGLLMFISLCRASNFPFPHKERRPVAVIKRGCGDGASPSPGRPSQAGTCGRISSAGMQHAAAPAGNICHRLNRS